MKNQTLSREEEKFREKNEKLLQEVYAKGLLERPAGQSIETFKIVFEASVSTFYRQSVR